MKGYIRQGGVGPLSRQGMALSTLAALSLLFVVVAPAPTTAAKSGAVSQKLQTYHAEVRITDFGVPHVKADDYGGLGFGIGYVSAQDTLCELADRVVTTSAQRARYFGASASNIRSDLYYQYLIDSRTIEGILEGDPASIETPSAQAREFRRGFAAGVSRYIRETGVDNLPDPRCRGAEWVSEIDELDTWQPGSVTQLDAIVAAQPPVSAAGALAAVFDDEPLPDPETIGSNAYGLGAAATASGRGMLLGNPHYPWAGQNRFHRMHLTIPGKLNVVGAGLINTGSVGIGHNATMAWTHTVSTARRFGYFELTLNPENPTEYLYEGEWQPMGEHPVTIQARQSDGSLAPVTGTIYTTRFGPMVMTSTFPWTSERGFAIRTFSPNLRSVDQYLAIWQAKDVRELFAALARYQATGFNTIAADASGEAFLGDVGTIPHVTEEKAAACIISPLGWSQWNGARMPVLDGSRAECEWGTDPDAAVPGAFSAASAPHLFRNDYVHQANDSHWLTNPDEPLEGYSRIFGDERTQRSLRTRMGLHMVHERIAGTDGLPGVKFDLETLQQVMYGNRNLSAEMARDDLVDLCEQTGDVVISGVTVDLRQSCEVLADWDLRVHAYSRGAHLWRQFAANGGLRWQSPFDANDPVNTPHTLDTADTRVITALGQAVRGLGLLGLPLDRPWGDVHFVIREGERIQIHGGSGAEGIFNVISATGPVAGFGWPNVVSGASWIMAVEFTDDGPRSVGVLTYSQSTNPESPHFADQTRLYSSYGWDDLRFAEEGVVAGTVHSYVVSEGQQDCLRNGWRKFGAPTFKSQGECVSYFTTMRGGVAPAR
jgi:acyl-homoserine-lactone acylase